MGLKKTWKTRGFFLLLGGDPDCYQSEETN